MTVKDKTGRRRYAYLKNVNSHELRGIIDQLGDAKIVNFKGITAIKVRHDRLPVLREILEKMGLKIDIVSGTLRALKKKVLKIH
ncbi:MAG: hypothetical protein QXO03_02890 [Thermoplasmatales archaeon]